MLRIALLPLLLPLLTYGQGVPDDGLTDSTQALQSALDTGHLHLAGDPLGVGAQITAVIADGAVASLRIDSPGSRYCVRPALRIEGGATAVAEVDANCRLSGARILNPGSDYTTPPRVFIVPRARCYMVTQLRIPSGAVMEGDGHSSCLIPGDPAKPVLFSEGAHEFRLRDFAVHGLGKADVGLQFNGGTTGDAAMCTLDNIAVSGFRQKNIELNKSYGFVLQNVHSAGSGGWGLYLRDGYNNATQIISGEYSGNEIGGVYVGAHSIQFHFSSIAESNRQYGIFYRGPSHGLLISDAYFEANGHDGTGWDLRGEYNDYDWPTRGLTVRNTLFNSRRTEGAAFLENTMDVDLSHNTGMPPMLGDAFTTNYIRIGKGAGMVRFDGNTGLALRNVAGSPVTTDAPPGTINLLTTPLPALIRLTASSGAANPTTIERSLSVPAGHLAGAGAWMKTDTGTASAWVEIGDEPAYTGTMVNQPHRQTIGPEWQWVAMNIGTDNTVPSAKTRAAFRIYRNDGSTTKVVYLRAGQAWRDIAGTPARNTIQSFSVSGNDTRRTSTSAGDSAISPSKPR